MRVAEKREMLRAALIAAAEAKIAAEGLGGLRARDLATAVGCALGAIYTVFPDLDALILAVNARTLDEIEAALAAVEPGEDAAGTALARLAGAYLDYAAAHRPRWDALFTHRLPAGAAVPDWYRARQVPLFHLIEGPLGRLRPDLPEAKRAAFARSLFSAVHGVVALGLSEKLAPTEQAALAEQLRLIVETLARGLQSTTASTDMNSGSDRRGNLEGPSTLTS